MAAAPRGEPATIALSGWRLQLAVILVAGALWAAYPSATFGALVVAYLLAWALLGALDATRRRLEPRLAIGLAVVLAAAPIARAAQLTRDFAENEALDAGPHLIESAIALEDTPAIFPRLVSLDRAQTFYAHAPGASRLTARFGADDPIEATSLGHGLFRIEVHGDAIHRAEGADAGAIDVVLTADGSPTTRTLRAVRPLPHPRALSPSPDRTRVAAVSEETDEAFVLSEDGELAQFDTDDAPIGAQFVSDSAVAVAHRGSTRLRLFGIDGAARGAIEVGPDAARLAVSPDRSRLAVALDGATPEVVLVDADPLRVATRVRLGFAPDAIAFGADARTLIVSEVRPARLHRFVDGAPDGEPIALSRPVVALGAGGARLVAAVTDYRPDGQEHLGNHFVEDTLLTIDVARWRVIEARRTAGRSARQRSPGDYDLGVSPIGVDVHGDAEWVACAGTDDVLRYTRGAPVPRVFSLEEPLAAPRSAVGFASGGFAVSSPVYGAIGILDRSGEVVTLARFAPGDQELLRDDEAALKRRIGERTFYESTVAGVSCQSCHLHGGSDQARHNIGGSTMVATLDVRGAADTPPYLRDGGYPTLGSLDDVAHSLYRGYRRRQGGRRPGLDAYLASLPRAPRRDRERDLARERRGVDAFVRARCVVCHAFPAFTNLSQHEAEWMFPGREGNAAAHQLDTPTLIGLDRSAPYLVDGRAETVEEVLRDHDPARRHGDWRALDEAALADLVYLLEGL